MVKLVQGWKIIYLKCLTFRYLQVEWDNKKAETEGQRVFDKDTIKGANPKCPQQTNFSDCGVYVLQYVESFYEVHLKIFASNLRLLRHCRAVTRSHAKTFLCQCYCCACFLQMPIVNYEIPMRNLEHWFRDDYAMAKRDRLRQLIISLQKELNPSLEYDFSQDTIVFVKPNSWYFATEFAAKRIPERIRCSGVFVPGLVHSDIFISAVRTIPAWALVLCWLESRNSWDCRPSKCLFIFFLVRLLRSLYGVPVYCCTQSAFWKLWSCWMLKGFLVIIFEYLW